LPILALVDVELPSLSFRNIIKMTCRKSESGKPNAVKKRKEAGVPALLCVAFRVKTISDQRPRMKSGADCCGAANSLKIIGEKHLKIPQ
jgi:hypothetical protein